MGSACRLPQSGHRPADALLDSVHGCNGFVTTSPPGLDVLGNTRQPPPVVSLPATPSSAGFDPMVLPAPSGPSAWLSDSQVDQTRMTPRVGDLLHFRMFAQPAALDGATGAFPDDCLSPSISGSLQHVHADFHRHDDYPRRAAGDDLPSSGVCILRTEATAGDLVLLPPFDTDSAQLRRSFLCAESRQHLVSANLRGAREAMPYFRDVHNTGSASVRDAGHRSLRTVTSRVNAPEEPWGEPCLPPDPLSVAGRAATPWQGEGIPCGRRAFFVMASLLRCRRYRPSPLLRLALRRNSSPGCRTGFCNSRLTRPEMHGPGIPHSRQSTRLRYRTSPARCSVLITAAEPSSTVLGLHA
jgi:hypothetical protein